MEPLETPTFAVPAAAAEETPAAVAAADQTAAPADLTISMDCPIVDDANATQMGRQEAPDGPAADMAPAASAAVSDAASPPTAPQLICASCGETIPDGDVFCGFCGTPLGGTPTAAAAMTAPAPAGPAAASAAAFATPAAAYAAPSAAPLGTSLTARGLQAANARGRLVRRLPVVLGAVHDTAAVAVFWIAEGVNLAYWILHWINYRYGGVETFLWTVFGFVLFAVIIRIVTEAAVAASRVRDEASALRRERARD
jgi:hypothetical protein